MSNWLQWTIMGRMKTWKIPTRSTLRMRMMEKTFRYLHRWIFYQKLALLLGTASEVPIFCQPNFGWPFLTVFDRFRQFLTVFGVCAPWKSKKICLGVIPYLTKVFFSLKIHIQRTKNWFWQKFSEYGFLG